MENDFIRIRGARENNLKNVDLDIPRNKFVVLTGLSGSGKSSLAFDTIFAEGQRRYMESLSSYARQFLGMMQKPDVDTIEGLSPAIAIDQKTTSKNPRSTVGTVTEIYDYFRLLYGSIGHVFCPHCKKEIKSLTAEQIVDKILTASQGSKLWILAPTIRGRKGEYTRLLESYKKAGFVRVIVDGIEYELGEEIPIEKNKKHTVSVVVDRLIIRDGITGRLTEAVETALKLADGLVVAKFENDEVLYSSLNSCPDCGFTLGELNSRLFSFNAPFGACGSCTGLGIQTKIDENLLIVNRNLSLNQGAIKAFGWGDMGMATMYYKGLAKKFNFSLDTPVAELPREILDIILYGTTEKLELAYQTANYKGEYVGKFEGVIPNLLRRYKETTSDFSKAEIEKLMVESSCPECKGKRLNQSALSVKINGKNIFEVCEMSIGAIIAWVKGLELTNKEKQISAMIIKEILARLQFLMDVGLDYLSLTRASGTLSGGEAQRIRLATQIGSGLVGVTYILDEPSIGLHPRDTKKLISTLKHLRDLGNTVLVVEHDEETMLSADYIIDIRPKAGVLGGQVVAFGTPKEVSENENSVTGAYLSGRKQIEIPKIRRKATGELTLLGCKQNNLKNIDVSIPLGVITAVTGVSGSGKSSLINEILHPALMNRLNSVSHMKEGQYEDILGIEQLDKAIVIDQSPIGRTPRSNPATYTGVFTAIRELFASTPEAKAKGYGSSRFSFNVKGGRCEACGGDGLLKIEMHFLPDVYVTCEDCDGKRYNRETLEVTYKGKNINDVLEMTIEEALSFFENIPSIKNKVQALYDVGLGYIKLGQPATTLSGGEAQRVKLATELSKRPTGKTIYILDEPTTGLHTADVQKLLDILNRLVSGGNTILLIEHNLDVIKTADYIIDLGPEGGAKGGTIVATGTPEQITKIAKSYTGNVLKSVIK
ncbi:MAG: excinuclease ABC subunit UvrA [Clostridia bacterium]|nr:excinuclease ABC subunit UvrA [Clostridia bacterium]